MMKPNQTRMTACRQNPLCNTGRAWRSVSLAPEFLHKFFRLSCFGSALNSNVSLETRMCVCGLRSFTGPQDRVLTCLSQYQKRTWFHPEEERAPEFFKYHSVHKVHRSLSKAHGPYICTPTPPSKPLWCGSLQTAPSLWNDCITDLEFSGQLSRYKSKHTGLHDVHSARDRLRVHFHLND